MEAKLMAQKILHWLLVDFLGFTGVYSLLLGGYLIYHRGSFYYLLLGCATLVITL